MLNTASPGGQIEDLTGCVGKTADMAPDYGGVSSGLAGVNMMA